MCRFVELSTRLSFECPTELIYNEHQYKNLEVLWNKFYVKNTFEAAISVTNLLKTYEAICAVDGISFDVRHGEVFGMLGPNGAGKTTTVEIIEGLRTADDGNVTVLGMDVSKDVRAIKERIGKQNIT